MNNQLEKQVVLLRDKLGQLKIPSRDGKVMATAYNIKVNDMLWHVVVTNLYSFHTT